MMCYAFFESFQSHHVVTVDIIFQITPKTKVTWKLSLRLGKNETFAATHVGVALALSSWLYEEGREKYETNYMKGKHW